MRNRERMKESEGELPEVSLRSFVAANTEAMTVVDEEGVVRFVNAGAEELFARRAGDLVGKMMGKPVGGAGRVELQVSRRGGGAVMVEMGVTRVKWEGRGAFLASLHDVTTRKHTEEELRRANGRLVESMARLERHAVQLSRLNEMAEKLGVCLTEEAAHEVMAQELGKFFASDQGALYVLGGRKEEASVIASWGGGREEEKSFGKGECRALEQGAAYTTQAGWREARCGHARSAELQEWTLCLPMFSQGEALAVLHVRAREPRGIETREAKQEWWDEKERTAQAVCEHLALSLANLRLWENLREQSIRDSLTGFYNRRFMEEWLTRALLHSEREGRPLGVLLMDMDNFKEINDRNGHDAGDALLRALGELLPQRVRAGDIVCRYGGEEFVLLLQDGDAQVSLARGRVLLNDVPKLVVNHGGKSLAGITASIGVAAYPEHGETPEELLRAADAAMYLAKRTGKNRLVVAAKAPGTGEKRGKKD